MLHDLLEFRSDEGVCGKLSAYFHIQLEMYLDGGFSLQIPLVMISVQGALELYAVRFAGLFVMAHDL